MLLVERLLVHCISLLETVIRHLVCTLLRITCKAEGARHNIHDYFKTSLNTMEERRGKGGHS
ncbi:hypothetical protein ANABIO32_07090 [Rossellomorea marisflavi]|nr:hypothetical protein ANABIO32_07090 [Rossellomorea marisflavi]